MLLHWVHCGLIECSSKRRHVLSVVEGDRSGSLALVHGLRERTLSHIIPHCCHELPWPCWEGTPLHAATAVLSHCAGNPCHPRKVAVELAALPTSNEELVVGIINP